MKEIIFVVIGIVFGYIMVLIRNKIIKKGIEEVKEKFDTDKFLKGMFSVSNNVLWAKDISSTLNARKIIIYSLIIGVIFGYGWYKGRLGAPVQFNLHGKEALIKLNGHFLRIDKNGNAFVVDKDGKILKTIRVKDIPSLRKALRPYGLIFEPIVVAGVSLEGKKEENNLKIIPEGGIGVSWFKYFKAKLDSFITNKALYPFGVSYSITDNSGIGLGLGIGYKGDERVLLYYKWRF